MVAAVAASIAFPAIARSPVRELVGIVVYAALASIVPTIAYAVVVERALEVQFAVPRARQWRAVRLCASFAGVVPLSYLVLDVHFHQDLTLAAYVSGGRGVLLFLLTMAGFTALTFRHQIVDGVDTLFRAKRLGSAEALAQLEADLKHVVTVRDATAALGATIERSVGATRVAVLVADERRERLVPLSGEADPLKMTSILADVVRSACAKVHVPVGSGGTLWRLLPEEDRSWLREAGADMIVPLLGSTGALLGFVALAANRYEIPYSDQDFGLVRSLCVQVGLRLENQWLREQPSLERMAYDASERGIHWAQEPARLCLRCSRAWPSTAASCECGSPLETAALPLLTAGKFQLERQLGSGGMGVVYLATDVALGRSVALKTLPRVSPSRAERLQREARAMATVLHPNLAVIYGAEQWRGNPVLIVEYLEGGTVLDTLRRGWFSTREMLGLGILIADVLDRLHGVGILHRDVKPSNIGYTLAGTPKLLDLGLAGAFAHKEPTSGGAKNAFEVASVNTDYALASDSSQLGTLRYMAPEAIAGAGPRPAFDLWALSLVLYEVTAGRHPVVHTAGHDLLDQMRRARFPDVREFRRDCPPAVADFLRDALAADPSRRPATAAEVRSRLQRLLPDAAPVAVA
jgi:hypothetical protein